MARTILAIAVAGTAFWAGGTALGVGPASAETKIYHWRTEAGTYAFTDDEKAIPDRYRSQVETREVRGLEDYERYTPAVSSGPPGHEEAAPAPAPRRAPAPSAAESRRIEYLRALNTPQSSNRSGSGQGARISIPTGGANSPIIDLPTGDGDEPVVIERVRTQPKGSSVTRTNTVVRQGDRILTIVKPQPNQTNTTSDILDEDELLER